MAPVLFLFLMMAFAETLELVWKERDIPILCVMTTANEHITEGKFAATHLRCSNPKNAPCKRYCNVYTWTTVPFHTAQYNIKKALPLHHMCSLRGFTKMNRKHANMEVIKSNYFSREETQSFSL